MVVFLMDESHNALVHQILQGNSSSDEARQISELALSHRLQKFFMVSVCVPAPDELYEQVLTWVSANVLKKRTNRSVLAQTNVVKKTVVGTPFNTDMKNSSLSHQTVACQRRD